MMCNRYLLVLLGCLALTASGCSERGEANSQAVDLQLPSDVTTDDPAPVDADENELDEAFLGTWQLEDHGLRTVLLMPDGTATMHVELDFFASLIYGNEMTMDLTWSIDDGILSYTIVGGAPVDSVNQVILDYGRERSYRILTVGEERIQLEDMTNPGTIHDWMNVGDLPGQG